MTAKAPPEVVLSVIRWYVERFGYAPTVREIAIELDVSKSTVHETLVALELAGQIERKPSSARAIRIVEVAS
jgi:repressor LexA